MNTELKHEHDNITRKVIGVSHEVHLFAEMSTL